MRTTGGMVLLELLARWSTRTRQVDRRNGVVGIVGALVDPYAAGGQPDEHLLEPRHVIADCVLRPVGLLDIVEGNLDRRLHGCSPAGA
jgi:hypothetical protein